MTKAEVFAWLEQHKNERGIAIMERTRPGVKSYGVGVTKLKDLAKKIKKDHTLALELWEERGFETRILATLIMDAKQMSLADIEQLLEQEDAWMIVYSLTGAIMAIHPNAKEAAVEWCTSKKSILRQAGYLTLSKIAKDNTIPDSFFADYLKPIEANLQTEDNFVKDGMNLALIAIGSRSKDLNTQATAIAKKLGKVVVDYGDNSCQALDATKYLTNPKMLEKLS